MEAAEAAAKSREGSAEIGRDLIEVAWDHVRSASGPFAPPGPTTYGGGALRDGLQPDGRPHYNGRMSIRMETTHAIDRPRSGVAGRSADASARRRGVHTICARERVLHVHIHVDQDVHAACLMPIILICYKYNINIVVIE